MRFMDMYDLKQVMYPPSFSFVECTKALELWIANVILEIEGCEV